MSIRKVSDDSMLSLASLHEFIPVIYFDLQFQIHGGLSIQGHTPYMMQEFWTLSAFLCPYYNGYSYK